MRNGEPNMYTALANLRNGYVQGQWSRLQLFLTFNAIGLPIVISDATSPQVKLLLSGMAVLIHYAVLLGSIRANRWIEFWDNKLANFERLDKSRNKIRVAVFSDKDFGSKRKNRFSTRFSFIPLAGLIVGFWVFELLYYGYLLIK